MAEIKTKYPLSKIENPYIPKNELEKQRAETVQKTVKVLGESNKTLFEINREERLKEIDDIWINYSSIQENPELLKFFSRTDVLTEINPKGVLKENNFPERSTMRKYDICKEWKINDDDKFLKDGFVYLLRGDYPNQENKGFYSFPFSYGKLNNDLLSNKLKEPKECGYFLYNDTNYYDYNNYVEKNIIEQLAYLQSAVGRSSFISTTSNLDCAISGTGNNPSKQEQSSYEIYILKIPKEFVLKRPQKYDIFGMKENEYIVSDYILPEEIIGKFSNKNKIEIFEFLKKQIDIEKEDIGL